MIAPQAAPVRPFTIPSSSAPISGFLMTQPHSTSPVTQPIAMPPVFNTQNNQQYTIDQLTNQMSNIHVTPIVTDTYFSRYLGDKAYTFNTNILASGLVFENSPGGIVCIGVVGNTVGNNTNPLPPDFLSMINQTLTDEQENWLLQMNITKQASKPIDVTNIELPVETQGSD
jgi:hypothetical protein